MGNLRAVWSFGFALVIFDFASAVELVEDCECLNSVVVIKVTFSVVGCIYPHFYVF